MGQVHKAEDPTQMCESVSFVDFLQTSSLQMGQRNYTISFEDNFMEEHERALTIQVENFMEFSLKDTGFKKLAFDNEQLFGEELEFGSFKNPEDLLVDFQGQDALITEARDEENIEKFFIFMFESNPKRIASEMLYVCSYAFSEWSSAIMSHKTFESEIDAVREAKRLAEKLGEKLFRDEKIAYLNLRKATDDLQTEETVLSAFKTLVEFLVGTVGLIGSGFFSNPYSENRSQAKRNRPLGFFGEEELAGEPCKKMH